MSYAHRELDRINRAMNQWQPTETLVRLRIAKETIEWMLDPARHFAPSDSIQNEQVRMSRVAPSPNVSSRDRHALAETHDAR